MSEQLAISDVSCQLARGAIDEAPLFCWTAPVLEGADDDEELDPDPEEDPEEDDGAAAELDWAGVSGLVWLCELRTMPIGVTFPVELGEF